MAEDTDIESYWEWIRPSREPVPEPRRQVHQHAARFRESFKGTDEEWDRRALELQAGGLLHDPRSFTMDEIREDCEERARLLHEWGSAEDLSNLWERPPPLTTPNPPVVLVGPQRTPEQIEAWNRSEEEARQRIRSRDEALREGAERGRALAPIRQALIVELGREPTRQEIQDAWQTLRHNETMTETRDRLRAQEELEAAVHRGDRTEWAQLVSRHFSNTVPSWMLEAERDLLQRRLGREPTLDELNQVLTEAEIRLRENQTDSNDWPPGVPEEQRHLAPTLEEARAFVHGDFLSPPSPPAASHEEFSVTRSILTRIADDLGALGFLPESITIERSIEGAAQSLTIHMPMTQLTQLTGPGHSSVIFTNRR